MDRAKAEAMLTDARAELVTARSAVSYLEQVVSGLEGLLKTAPEIARPAFAEPEAPETAPVESAGENAWATPQMERRQYPRTPDAVLTVLKSRPNLPMTFKTIWAEMTSLDLIDPAIKSGRNAYTNSARRLADDPSSSVFRDEMNRYVYRTDPPAVTVPAPDMGGGPFLKAVSTS